MKRLQIRLRKIFAPKSLYYSALIYKENKMDDIVELIKSELQKGFYELGPLFVLSIDDL